MFSAALFMIAKIWEQPRYPLTHEWIKKIWCVYVCMYIYIYTHTYIHTMEYYPAIKNNETMLFAAMWMGLEITILSEVNQNKKDKYCTISLICGV